MITLNNGQKPMSARHQVEILANNLYSFDSLLISLQSEKQSKKHRIVGAFKKADIIKSYLAFISQSINIDNQKIIESKLDELITDQIIESDIPDRNIEFSSIIELIHKFSEDQKLLDWFRISNNLIGFTAGIYKSFVIINSEEISDFKNSLENFDSAFSYLDISKIKLGLARRKSVKHFIENYDELKKETPNQLINIISQVV